MLGDYCAGLRVPLISQLPLTPIGKKKLFVKERTSLLEKIRGRSPRCCGLWPVYIHSLKGSVFIPNFHILIQEFTATYLQLRDHNALLIISHNATY